MEHVLWPRAQTLAEYTNQGGFSKLNAMRQQSSGARTSFRRFATPDCVAVAAAVCSRPKMGRRARGAAPARRNAISGLQCL